MAKTYLELMVNNQGFKMEDLTEETKEFFRKSVISAGFNPDDEKLPFDPLLAPGENRHFEPGENSQFQPGRNRQSVPGGCSQPRFGYRF